MQNYKPGSVYPQQVENELIIYLSYLPSIVTQQVGCRTSRPQPIVYLVLQRARFVPNVCYHTSV